MPYWTYKKGLINNKTFVPTKENPFVDAYSGATPKNNFVFETLNISKIKKYRILLEVNQTWDWNKFWNNSKFPNNNAYKHSAQPSVIYAVTINEKDSVYLLNPIGHGNPTGENGNLYTNLSTLCSAKEIFNSIKIEIK
ncbi:MAG: hypothetical protein JXA16_03360 [Bacteroidales bacterium]|nr:hypothetical protein [Bacteroidales bacterium]